MLTISNESASSEVHPSIEAELDRARQKYNKANGTDLCLVEWVVTHFRELAVLPRLQREMRLMQEDAEQELGDLLQQRVAARKEALVIEMETEGSLQPSGPPSDQPSNPSR